jgi:dimethylaniline monooxygenase (N-oxide forming)
MEARDGCGGQWLYEDVSLPPSTATPSSSMYQSVTIQSPRDMMSFSDFPMDPSRYTHFSRHDGVLAYLNEYADFFDLRSHIQFSSTVVKVQQRDDSKWLVWWQCNSAPDIHVDVFDAVFGCTGRHSAPRTPDFKNLSCFRGMVLHSHWYRTPTPFAGQKVLVIGLGNSGKSSLSYV